MRTESGTFFLKGDKRYRIISERILQSWAFPRIIQTSDIAISKYKALGKLGFRDGTLLWNIADGKIYLMESNLKRHIVSPEGLTMLGASHKDVVCVSQEELDLHKDGEEWR